MNFGARSPRLLTPAAGGGLRPRRLHAHPRREPRLRLPAGPPAPLGIVVAGSLFEAIGIEALVPDLVRPLAGAESQYYKAGLLEIIVHQLRTDLDAAGVDREGNYSKRSK